MAVLRVRDENGNIQEITTIKGDKGDSYVLTEADKQEIASMVDVSGGGVGLATKEELNKAVSDIDDMIGDIESLLGGI